MGGQSHKGVTVSGAGGAGAGGGPLRSAVENSGCGRDESMGEPSHKGVTVSGAGGAGSGGDHHDGDGGGDVGVEPDLHLDLAELLHRLVETHSPAVDLDAA